MEENRTLKMEDRREKKMSARRNPRSPSERLPEEKSPESREHIVGVDLTQTLRRALTCEVELSTCARELVVQSDGGLIDEEKKKGKMRR